MPLTDTAIRNLKPAEKAFKRADGAGLYLLVTPQGSRYWRFDYRHFDKRGTLALGVYPEVSLATARERRDLAREELAAGQDPGIAKLKTRILAKVAAGTLLRDVGAEFIEKRKLEGLSEKTLWKLEWSMRLIDRELGGMPIAEIEAPEILAALRKLERRGMADTPKRVRSLLGRVFRYGIATGRCQRDPAADLRDALINKPHAHHAAIFDPAEIGSVLRAIDSYRGSAQIQTALWILPRIFVRPGELRTAEWQHFDLKKGLWRIPAEKMKGERNRKRDHIVPLARQVVTKLRELQAMGFPGPYLFPCRRSHLKPMSDMTINAAFRRMGYDREELTAHGFRRTASTLLNEMGWNRDWIERQLAHLDGNEIRRIYNAAEYLPDRTKMMQAWANELDRMKNLPPRNIKA